VLVAPPVWLLARACMPGATWFDLVMRVLGVALAVRAMPGTGSDAPSAVRWPVLLSGLCAGAAVAAKLSNGPLAILMPGLWWLCGRGWRPRVMAVALGSAATLLGFSALYGYWGWSLWRYFGNPIFPFHHHWFEPLRRWAGMG
jgi:hypothetical protein